MTRDPHDPHHISADDFRKFAGLPKDLPRDLREEKVDLSTADIFSYIERLIYPSYQPPAVRLRNEKGDPSSYEVALSCCDALEKKGYSKEAIGALRTYITRMKTAEDARDAGFKGFQKLSTERWDKNEIY